MVNINPNNNGYLSRFLELKQKFQNQIPIYPIDNNEIPYIENNENIYYIDSNNNKINLNDNFKNEFRGKITNNKHHNSKFSNTEIPEIFDECYIQKRINKAEINYPLEENNILNNNDLENHHIQDYYSNKDYNLNLNENIDNNQNLIQIPRGINQYLFQISI